MKRTLALLALGTLSACTSTRIDDHSYHHNDTAPTQNITYSTTVIKQQAPTPRPSIPQTDREYLQYSQGQDAPARQSSYVAPSTYNYSPTTYNNYAAPPTYRYAVPAQVNYAPVYRYAAAPVYVAPVPRYRPNIPPPYCRQPVVYGHYRQPVAQASYSYNRPTVSIRARFQP